MLIYLKYFLKTIIKRHCVPCKGSEIREEKIMLTKLLSLVTLLITYANTKAI